jgi:hypothetical protein
MKTRLHFLFITLALLASLNQVIAQGTAFTYQGQLSNGTSPANGLYDFKFDTWSDVSGGSVIGGPVTNTLVTVSNGLFTTTIDLGAGVFTGGSNWLHIQVRTNGSTAFTSLSPRQQLTPTPYAIYSAQAATAATAGSATTSVAANNFSGPLAGDVTGTQGATVVATVGGLPAATVASGAAAAAAADSANTPNAIVTRDASGNFSAGMVSGVFNGDGSGLTNLPALSSTTTTIDNTSTNPVPVLDLQPNQPFQGFNGFTIPAGSSSSVGNPFFTVPAGKRLVIENISVYLISAAASSITSIFFSTTVNGTSGYHGMTITADGSTYPLGNLNQKMYADPGTQVFLNLYRTGSTTQAETVYPTITGYYINDP